MSGRYLVTALFYAALGGCSTLPEYREEPINTADVILNIKCQLRQAAWAGLDAARLVIA